MRQNQYALYRLRADPELEIFRHRTYLFLNKYSIPVEYTRYQLRYISTVSENVSLLELRDYIEDELSQKQIGNGLVISDVITVMIDGKCTAYYVDAGRLVEIAGFLPAEASSDTEKPHTAITIDTVGYRIDGKGGTWAAVDKTIIDGRTFFLMENELYRDNAAFAVVDENGAIAAEDTTKGFDPATVQRIRDRIQSEEASRNRMQEQSGDNTGQSSEASVSATENEEAASSKDRFVQSETAPRKTKRKVKPLNRRKSVLKRLHEKQRELDRKRIGKVGKQGAAPEINERKL